MNCDEQHNKQQTVIIVAHCMSPASVSSGSVGSVDIDMTVTRAGPTQRKPGHCSVGASLAVSGDLWPGPRPDIAIGSHSADIICRIFPRIFLVN